MSTPKKTEANERRQISLKRAEDLKERIEDYLQAREEIDTGFKLADEYKQNKQHILKTLRGTEEDWNNWEWHIQNRISDVKQLSKFLTLSDEEKEGIDKVGSTYRWAVSPYYLSLMSRSDSLCPIRRQALPHKNEIAISLGEDDPMSEEFTSPASAITRRYPDRLIINVTNSCAMFCRHCQRRRNIGEVDRAATKNVLSEAVKYIKDNDEIRDVLLTGGDALMLSDKKLDWLLAELDKIDHVEIIRIGTRLPVTLPQRITPELCDILDKYPSLYLSTQFNHPKEVTHDSEKACMKITRLAIPINNQAVLLRGVNNCPHTMKKLNHELLKIKVKPYYIFQAKTVKGTAHFITQVEDGINIMEHLRGYTSGLAIPTYIINAPRGHGKTPMLPEYLVSSAPGEISIRTWEGKVFQYPNKNVDFESG